MKKFSTNKIDAGCHFRGWLVEYMLYLVINHRFGLLVRVLLEKFGQIFCNSQAKKHGNRCNGKRPLMEEKWWTTGRGRHSVVKPTVPPLASKFSCTLSRLSSSTSAIYCATFFTTLWTVGRHQNTPWNTNCLHTASVNCTLTQPRAPNVTQTFTHQKTLHDLAKVLSWHDNFKCGNPRSTSKQGFVHRGGEYNAKKDHKGAFNLSVCNLTIH